MGKKIIKQNSILFNKLILQHFALNVFQIKLRNLYIFCCLDFSLCLSLNDSTCIIINEQGILVIET